jgi:hypothetical protein
MRTEDLLRLLRARPFRPFRLLTTNNLVYEIRHPELVAMARFVGLALLHIVQYEF